MAYASDFTVGELVYLEQNTSAVRHGKWVHDGIGGSVGNLFADAFRHEKFHIKEGQSPAVAARDWLAANCEWSFDKKGNKKMQRFFIVIPSAAIKYLRSPVKTFSIGIKQSHCMLVGANGNRYFRKYSCSCSKCLACDYDKCEKKEFCGSFKKETVAPYPKYTELVSKYDAHGNVQKKQRCDDSDEDEM